MLAALVAASGIDVAQPFGPAFAAAGRTLGKAPVDVTAIRAAGLVVPDDLARDEAGRMALVLVQVERVPDAIAFVRDLWRRGEVRERQAVLRVLAALPAPERFVEIGIDACRTNVLDVFCAIACDNAFPARHFPDAAFNQMALKALFIAAPVGRIHGLAGRKTAELTRMAEAYASERRAAGRPVPEDAKLLS